MRSQWVRVAVPSIVVALTATACASEGEPDTTDYGAIVAWIVGAAMVIGVVAALAQAAESAWKRKREDAPPIAGAAHGSASAASPVAQRLRESRPRADAVFISYRHDDVPAFAGRVRDRLVNEFGADRVFFDVESIGIGLDFESVIESALSKCFVTLVVVGPQFTHTPISSWVEKEVSSALGGGIPVVPVLVDGTALPDPLGLPESVRPLVRRQSIEMSHAGFESDVARLITDLRGVAARSAS